MSSITTQQTKIDLELVPKEKRLEIGKCNGRLNPRKKQRAYISSCPGFSCSHSFDELPTDEDIVSLFKELGHTGEIKTITDIVVDQMHQPWRTFATIINRSLSGKTTEVSIEEVARRFEDFHKTHPSGSGTVTKITPSAAKIKPSVTNEGTGVKPGVPDVTEEESTESNDQERDSGDDNTQSDSENGSDSEHETNENESGCRKYDQEENEEEIEDNEEEEEDEFVKPRPMILMMKIKQRLKIKLKKTEVSVTSSSHSSDLASKFLKFLDIPHIDAEIVSPMDVHVHHEVTTLEKEVVELKKNDPLNTQVTALVDEHLDS
ncbi:hypothetical protein Tco_0226611 [Tanacetum coccineum]